MDLTGNDQWRKDLPWRHILSDIDAEKWLLDAPRNKSVRIIGILKFRLLFEFIVRYFNTRPSHWRVGGL